jgi:hypothetical protein
LNAKFSDARAKSSNSNMQAASSGKHRAQGVANEPEKKEYIEIKKELYQEFKDQSHSLSKGQMDLYQNERQREEEEFKNLDVMI